jgi:hypothetical protein
LWVLGELRKWWSDDDEVDHQASKSGAKAAFAFAFPFRSWLPSTFHFHVYALSCPRMIIRSFARCARSRARPLARWKVHQQRPSRGYSTSSSTAPPSPPASSFSILGSVTSELDKISPRFEVDPSRIQILQSPSEFYETLKVSLLFSFIRFYSSSRHFHVTVLGSASSFVVHALCFPTVSISYNKA